MKKFFKNYKQTFILLASLIVGCLVGLILKEKAMILNPFGELFMNLMFVLIVPLIFLTVCTSIAKIKTPKRVGKLLSTIVIVFLLTSVVALVIGLATTLLVPLVKTDSYSVVMEQTSEVTDNTLELNILERTVSAISTNDFYKLLSKENLIALVLFAILVGVAINKTGEDGKRFLEFLESANTVILKLIDLCFLYAPIGLGCYFASLIGTYGESIATGFLKTFIIYLMVSILFYFIIYSLYAYFSGGKKGFKLFWKTILPPTATSIATCSSAASIPINIKSAKEMGIPDDIAETTIPLGTSFHKDGSIIGSVFKIMFLVYLFGLDIYNFSTFSKIIGTAFLANLLVTAVPVGGGTISEMLILTLMGFPVSALPILTIIATIIDAPATMLNVVGDTSSSMLVTRVLHGKNWCNQKNKEL